MSRREAALRPLALAGLVPLVSCLVFGGAAPAAGAGTGAVGSVPSGAGPAGPWVPTARSADRAAPSAAHRLLRAIALPSVAHYGAIYRTGRLPSLAASHPASREGLADERFSVLAQSALPACGDAWFGARVKPQPPEGQSGWRLARPRPPSR
jgi:hypothetical protein